MFGTYARLPITVSASNVAVIRAVRRKFRPSVLGDRSKKDQRKTVYRAMLAYHKEQQDIARQWRL